LRACIVDVGPEATKLLEKTVGGEHEDAAVPEVVAICEKLLGAFSIGFLGESRDSRRTPLQRDASLDVSISRLGCLRDDSERKQRAGSRDGEAIAYRRTKAVRFFDVVVSRHHEQDRIRAVANRSERRKRDGWRSAPHSRFENDRAARAVDCSALLRNEEAVLVIANDVRRCNRKPIQALE